MKDKLLDEKQEYMDKCEIYYEIGYRKKYENLELSEVHCIDSIKKIKKPNVTNLAKSMKMTKSGMSKMATNLVKKKFIEKFNIEGNKKEVHFKLTQLGKGIYEKHKESHQKILEDEMNFLEKFSVSELEIITRFFHESNNYLSLKIKDIQKKEEEKL